MIAPVEVSIETGGTPPKGLSHSPVRPRLTTSRSRLSTRPTGWGLDGFLPMGGAIMASDTHVDGLQRDLSPLLESGLTRRRWLRFAGALGAAAALPACARAPAAPVTATDAAGDICVRHARETAGPFPSDGSNRAGGTVSNALAESGVVREDIRASFGRATSVAPGTPMDIEMRLVDVNDDCAPLAGHALYVWHCTADGRYSLYEDGVMDENFLRGVQVSDADGRLAFKTIVPGCYRGRYPHLHYELYPNLAATSDHRARLLISQIAVPADVCASVYAGDRDYTASADNFRGLSLAGDGVFADNAPAETLVMTLTLDGDVAGGYTGSINVGVAV